MDTAKTFKPKTILLWQKAAEHPETQRILRLFPAAKVHIVEHQHYSLPHNMSLSKSLVASKRILMIGQTTSFVQTFDGELGSTVHCRPYYKLTPLSNGCPYYCTYCYLAFVYRHYSPFIKLNVNHETMFRQIRKTIARSSGNATFNMGEMLDSLAPDHITNLTRMLVPFFGGLSRAYLMLLTKSCNVDNLLTLEPNNHTIVSWSLNRNHAIQTYGRCGMELQKCQLVPGTSDDKLRYPQQQRIEFYTFLIDIIRSYDKEVSIGLCRATLEIWDALEDRCDRLKCNCLIW